jgi:uncharacterized repeat protein (TIGR03803 family)
MTAFLATAVLLSLTMTLAESVDAQTYNVIYNFANGVDGSHPQSGLTMDRAGNLYGTTAYGGQGCLSGEPPGCGTVFKLSRTGSAWVLTTIYSFQGGNDGANPYAQLVFGPDGSLYGTTYLGGVGCSGLGCGTVFRLKPGPNTMASWTETPIYRFQGADGQNPNASVVFDQAGNLYGTTANGGAHGIGSVFKLTGSNGNWTENVLNSFAGGNDGATPTAGVIIDHAGNLYGTTTFGGGTAGCLSGCGTVFQLTPSGSNWIERVLYRFQGASDGGYVYPGLIFDGSGNLYGATDRFGAGNGGTVFELTPSAGNWTFVVIHSFAGQGGPEDSLFLDSAGHLYGTTTSDGLHQDGSVFRLTFSNGNWSATDLYSFGFSDGGTPYCGVAFDPNGHLYGTAWAGGAHGFGVVWEITP